MALIVDFHVLTQIAPPSLYCCTLPDAYRAFVTLIVVPQRPLGVCPVAHLPPSRLALPAA